MSWADKWNTSIMMTSRERLNSGPFWDGRADRDRSCPFSRKLTDDQMAAIAPLPHHRLLEIGPGNGRLAISMARASSSVTLVDPSPVMLQALDERAKAEGVGNLTAINDYWERVDLDAIGTFDKVVSSYSLFMKDIGPQLRRMSSVADEVFLFVPGDIRIPFDVQEMMFGDVVVEHTDHEILTNIAEDLGLEPVAWTMEYPGRPGFDSIDEAVEHYLDLYGVPESGKGPIADHIASTLRERGGTFAMSDEMKVGAIWWQSI